MLNENHSEIVHSNYENKYANEKITGNGFKLDCSELISDSSAYKTSGFDKFKCDDSNIIIKENCFNSSDEFFNDFNDGKILSNIILKLRIR